MTKYFFHCKYPTNNDKLGPIAAITASRNTCPSDCPLNDGTCYHDQGYMAWHWDNYSAGIGKDVMQFDQMIDWVRFRLPPTTPLRYGVAGDVPGETPGQVRSFLGALSAAVGKRPAFMYSHRREWRHEPAHLDALLGHRITINLSFELEAQADAAVAIGLHAVLIVPSGEKRTAWTTAGGNRAVLCPHSRLAPDPRAPQCVGCRLCWKRPPHVIIAFPAHGSRKRQLDQKLIQLQEAA
jgi:hypothetical protein